MFDSLKYTETPGEKNESNFDKIFETCFQRTKEIEGSHKVLVVEIIRTLLIYTHTHQVSKICHDCTIFGFLNKIFSRFKIL